MQGVELPNIESVIIPTVHVVGSSLNTDSWELEI